MMRLVLRVLDPVLRARRGLDLARRGARGARLGAGPITRIDSITGAPPMASAMSGRKLISKAAIPRLRYQKIGRGTKAANSANTTIAATTPSTVNAIIGSRS